MFASARRTCVNHGVDVGNVKGHNGRVFRSAALLLLILLAGCLPIPDMRVDLDVPSATYRFAPERVRSEYVSVPGYAAPNTPGRYNKALYVRYTAPKVDEPSETVLILVPGIFGGAATMDIVARQLVASQPGLEVWTVDRRANLLEDRSATLESLRTGDPTTAYDYYVKNRGKKDGFNAVPPEEVPFLASWGLEVHLRDLHELVKRAHTVADTVVLGGHSLGASMTALYAAYNFGNESRPDLGDDHLDGLLLIDGTLGRTGAFSREGGVSVGPIKLVPDVASLESGRGNPYFTLAFAPHTYARTEALVLLAQLEPGELAPEDLADFPITNFAAAGLAIDDRYEFSPAFGASVGEPVGATFHGNLIAFLSEGKKGARSRSVSGVAEGYDAVRWERGDPSQERTDLRTLIASQVTADTNFNEWYFPIRLLLDMARLDVTLRDEPGFVPNSEVNTPTLAVGAGRGLVPTLDGFSAYNNARASVFFSAYVLPGLTHIDIVTAEGNPLVPLFGRWLGQVVEVSGR